MTKLEDYDMDILSSAVFFNRLDKVEVITSLLTHGDLLFVQVQQQLVREYYDLAIHNIEAPALHEAEEKHAVDSLAVLEIENVI